MGALVCFCFVKQSFVICVPINIIVDKRIQKKTTRNIVLLNESIIYIYQIYDLMKTISNKLVFIYFVCLKFENKELSYQF